MAIVSDTWGAQTCESTPHSCLWNELIWACYRIFWEEFLFTQKCSAYRKCHEQNRLANVCVGVRVCVLDIILPIATAPTLFPVMVLED